MWKSGDNPKLVENKSMDSFSSDKYGDAFIMRKLENGKNQKQLVRRATLYVGTIQRFPEQYWEELLDMAREYLTEFKSKRKRATSSSSSGPAEEETGIYDPDAAFVMDVF
jgi:hypothetical protein